MFLMSEERVAGWFVEFRSMECMWMVLKVRCSYVVVMKKKVDLQLRL